MADPLVVALVRRFARKYGVDPEGPLRVASVEGGLRRGAIGDVGSSYGPFQLHVGGALPRGRGPGWASSRAGIEYALRQMAPYARGKHGQAEVAAIVRRFERPADPESEIRRALAVQLGGLPAADVAGPMPQPMRPAVAAAPPQPAFSPLLSSVLASNNDLIGVPSPPLQLMTPRPPPAAPAAPAGSPPRQIATRGGRNVNLVRFARGADRSGVRTSRAVVAFVARIAALRGHPLVVGTGSNHNRMTVNGRVSDHWSGHAGDIPATGRELIRLGQDALIAAGANPAWARRQRGGLYNVNGHQVIFNTTEGGDHTNHLHVSAY